MHIIINLVLVITTVAVMEGISWSIHKYLFHGPLWFIHQSHHKPRTSWFEFNDVFSVFFGAISLYLMWDGRESLNTGFWVGVGISTYGIIYFIFHDWFIHNRVKPFKTNNPYLLGIRRAHKIHHKSMAKNPSEEFGLLLASGKYFRKHKKDQTSGIS